MKKMLFLVNPSAGKGQVRDVLLDILNVFVQCGYEVTIAISQGKMDGAKIVAQKGGNYPLLVCCGGDGTLNEVVQGLMTLENPPAVGYIPAGTTNDFATGLSLSKDMVQAAQNIMGGKPFLCDIGSFNEHYFTYIAAFGAFTEVAYETPQEFKNMLGHLAYVLEGIKRIYAIKTYHLIITHDGQRIEDDFIFGMVTNSTSIAGFRGISGRDVALDDGLFEVTLIKSPKNLMELQAIIGALLTQEEDSRFIDTFKTSSLVVTCEEELPWTLDGEYGGHLKEVKITNNTHGMRLIK